MSDLDLFRHRAEMTAERFASLLELAFGRQLFTRRDDPNGQLYTIRKIHKDGRVQLTTYPPAPQIPDVVVEPETLVPA